MKKPFSECVHMPIAISLGEIGAIRVAGALASWIHLRRHPEDRKEVPTPASPTA